ncbi:hypothetical protein H311_03809 [Anncaliia algerae PRA109]|nr:hypothetical protein H311_03809 [Anncaliia algerae PRA109]
MWKEGTKDILTNLLIKNVEKETIIYSDCWKSYYELKKCFFSH